MAWDYQFVDSIAASPTVRLNLTTDWYVRSETSFGMPELRRAEVSSLLADGEQYPAAAYSNRIITLVVEHKTPGSPDAVAASLQTLVRELDRPQNLLRYQPGTTEPVFFRTFRTPPSNVRWDGARKVLTIDMPAEPFALGLRETLSAATVNNNPAAGSNGMFFDVSAPKGDVETPLYLQMPTLDVSRSPESGGSGRRVTAIAVRRRGTPSAMPALLQAESMTTGTDTTVQPASESSGTFLRTTFATATSLQVRASATWPASPSTDLRGTYRVFLRARKSVSTDTIQVQTQFVNGAAYVTSDLVAGPAGTVWRWLDMGLLQLPAGYDPTVDGQSGVPIPVGGMGAYVYAARTGGSGNLDVDALLFLPADDRLCLVKWPESSSETSFVLDSAAGQVYSLGSAGEVRASFVELVGGPPMVSPGVANRIWFMRDVGSTYNTGDNVAATVQVTPYYWPRYLFVRGVAL